MLYQAYDRQQTTEITKLTPPRPTDTHQKINRSGQASFFGWVDPTRPGWAEPNTSLPFHRLRPLMDRVSALEKLIGDKPRSWQKPVYGHLDYIIAWRMGWISDEDEQRDRMKYEERRQRSLRSCHRPRYRWVEDLRRKPFQTGAYIPEMPAHVMHDPDLTDGAKVCLAKIMEETYRMNRDQRWLATTISYLMAALGRCRRTIQNYLRLLEHCGYITCEVLLGAESRMSNGLKINLCESSFARHHKEKWPFKNWHHPFTEDEIPPLNSENSGAQKDSLNYWVEIYIYKNILVVPVLSWAVKCMNGIHKRLMQNNPRPDKQILLT
jgi:hypothetical protein